MIISLKLSTQATMTLALLFLLGTVNAKSSIQRGLVTLPNTITINVEIAADANQRRQGLMHRNALEPDQGMLFVYPYEEHWGVWMKNTLLHLDVIFISEQGSIVDIAKNLSPCRKDPCPIVRSKTPARYMLEINAGLSDRYALTPDQKLLLEYQHNDTLPIKQAR